MGHHSLTLFTPASTASASTATACGQIIKIKLLFQEIMHKQPPPPPHGLQQQPPPPPVGKPMAWISARRERKSKIETKRREEEGIFSCCELERILAAAGNLD
jgi:hypothetical protein